MKNEYEISLLSSIDQSILGELDEASISPEVRRQAAHPYNMRSLDVPDGQSSLTGICEDTIGIELHLDGTSVVDVCFQARGCGFTLACGSAATELIRGKELKEAFALDGKKIAEVLGGLPREHMHCADLAANAVQAALHDALTKRREPWKRIFEK